MRSIVGHSTLIDYAVDSADEKVIDGRAGDNQHPTVLIVLFVVAACALVTGIGADARWLAALGRYVVQTGGVPNSVPFAAAPSGGWSNVPVLGELLFYALHSSLGDRGLLLAQLAAVAAAFGAVARDMARAQVRTRASAIVLVLMAVALGPALVVVRSQLLSLALFPPLLLLLRAEARAPSRRVWLLVPLLALWSNLHGAVLVGLGVAGCYLLLHRARRERFTAAVLLAVSPVALLATPALLGTIGYYRGVLDSAPAVRGEGYWAPLSLHHPFDLVFLAVALTLIAAALRTRPRLWELVVLAGLVAGTIHASRNGVWLALFIATPAALGIPSRARRFHPSTRFLTLCATALILLLAVGLARGPIPTGASNSLRREAKRAACGTPILADPVNAELLALDGTRIWIGNPIDAFRISQQRLYLDWLAARPKGDAALASAPRAVVVERNSRPAGRLALNSQFHRVAWDKRASLFLRSGVALGSTCSRP